MSTSGSVKRVLTSLLRDPGNGSCADCKAQSHPRWASWSLGVFVCIKCAGVHRSLGTHISKVKSVDLDTWKEEHLEKLVEMRNNVKANEYYECRLAAGERGAALTDMGKIQQFIRSKYEQRKWVGEAGAIGSTSSPARSASSSASASPRVGPTAIKNLSEVSLASTQSNTKPEVNKSSSLLDLQSLSSGPNNNTAQGPSRPLNSPVVRGSPAANTTQRHDLKKSILSLYSKPSNSSFANGNANGMNNNINNINRRPSLQSNMSSSSLSIASTADSLSNNNNSNNNSTYNIDDNELLKNVWTT